MSAFELTVHATRTRIIHEIFAPSVTWTPNDYKPVNEWGVSRVLIGYRAGDRALAEYVRRLLGLDAASVILATGDDLRDAIRAHNAEQRSVGVLLVASELKDEHERRALRSLLDDAHALSFYLATVVVVVRTEWPRLTDDTVVTFPWDAPPVFDRRAVQTDILDVPRRLLAHIGEDVKREGLRDTPRRFIEAWEEYTSGYNVDVGALFTAFEDGAEEYDEMIVVRDIPVYSMCEHHMAPFFGVAHVGYVPGEHRRIVGLSKINRVVDAYARRLQVQERLTRQIADAIDEHLMPSGVGVVLQCRHLCMESRGVRQQGHSTMTSCLRGVFRDGPARAEFLRLSHQGRDV